jgi:hypothetical protein
LGKLLKSNIVTGDAGAYHKKDLFANATRGSVHRRVIYGLTGLSFNPEITRAKAKDGRSPTPKLAFM